MKSTKNSKTMALSSYGENRKWWGWYYSGNTVLNHLILLWLLKS